MSPGLREADREMCPLLPCPLALHDATWRGYDAGGPQWHVADRRCFLVATGDGRGRKPAARGWFAYGTTAVPMFMAGSPLSFARAAAFLLVRCC